MNAKANRLVKILKEKQFTLALAESITCGMASELLANSIGTSEVFKGSIVCYSPEVKRSLMGISKKLIDTFTAESMQVTEALVRKLPSFFNASVYAALTGLAAPGASETKRKPVGTVFLCVLYNRKIYKKRMLFRGTPRQIREKACLALFGLIVSRID
jgi:nicotinamide-nucleotide amidase